MTEPFSEKASGKTEKNPLEKRSRKNYFDGRRLEKNPLRDKLIEEFEILAQEGFADQWDCIHQAIRFGSYRTEDIITGAVPQ